jgi:hypothetical protein
VQIIVGDQAADTSTHVYMPSFFLTGKLSVVVVALCVVMLLVVLYYLTRAGYIS